MSMNNYTEIKYNLETKNWEVWNKDADTDSGFIEFSFKTRDEAIDSIGDIYSEYGLLHIDPLVVEK